MQIPGISLLGPASWQAQNLSFQGVASGQTFLKKQDPTLAAQVGAEFVCNFEASCDC